MYELISSLKQAKNTHFSFYGSFCSHFKAFCKVLNLEEQLNNQAKLKILAAVRTLGEVTAREIALITNRTPECASMNLLRYHGMGLLRRRKLHGKTMGYSLTRRGLERLKWLESDLE